ncbi:MAG: HlyD family secretion protein [Nevskia sp.]|nr:HlyD family secretion protein [Nevskia sp.]
MAVVGKSSLRILVAVVVVIGLVVFGIHWWTSGRFMQSTDDAYVRADSSVITPRVGGEVLAVHVVDNQLVHQGDVLVEIDPRDYAARVANAQAAVASAQASLVANAAQLRLQQANIAEARANVAAAQADQVRSQKDWERAQQLVRDGVATTQRLDTARAAFKSGEAAVARSDAALQATIQQVSSLQADTDRLQAQIKAQAAMLQLAQLDLDATTLRAPIDGSVGDLAARVGERIGTGARLLTLVPLQAVYVEANYKETQLTRMRIGQSVSVKVDAFPGHGLRAHVDSVSPASGAEFALLPAQNATGNFTKIVQRVPVKIVLEADEPLRGQLRPGMSVVATVDTRAAGQTAAPASPLARQ